MKNKSIVVIRSKLLTYMTKTKIKSRQFVRGITPDKEEDDCLSLNKYFLNRHASNSSTAILCTHVV